MSETAYLVVVYRGNEIDDIDEVHTDRKRAEDRAYYLNTIMDDLHYEAFVEERNMLDVMGKELYQLKRN